MTGIYKITSPSGKVYIGQSWDIKKRHAHYAALDCKEQPKLYHSLKKHGYNNHTCETVITFPTDITQAVLDAYEIFVINQFTEAGIPLLNLKAGGMGGKLSKESKEKIKAKRILQPPPTLGLVHKEITKQKMSAAHLGKPKTKEAIEKSRIANTGRKHTDEAKIKMRAGQSIAKTWTGRKHSEASKQKQSARKIGHKINNKKVQRIDTGEIFNSQKEAAASIGIKYKTLSYRMSNNTNIEPRFIFYV